MASVPVRFKLEQLREKLEGAFDSPIWKTNNPSVVWGVALAHLFVPLVLVLSIQEDARGSPAVGFVAGIPVAFLYLLNIRPDIIPGLLKVPAGDSVFYISFHTCRIVLMKRDAPDADVFPCLSGRYEYR